jgi:hypothetical protein
MNDIIGMASVDTSLTINEIIITGISNICSKSGLNAEKFRLSPHSNKLYWNAVCGIIGKVQFNIQYDILQENLEKGLQLVSTIIAFTDLLRKEENHRFTENIMRAHNECRSPCYFNIPPSFVMEDETDSSRAVMTYIPLTRSNFYGLHSYLAIQVQYTSNPETGEYTWVIPDTPEVPVEVRLNRDEMTGMLFNPNDTLQPPEYARGITAGYAPIHLTESPSTAQRVGLERGFSSGIPVSVATQTIEDSLTPYRAVNI